MIDQTSSDEKSGGEMPGDPKPAKRSGSAWGELVILGAVAVTVALLVRVFVMQTFFIPSGSMEHTLEVHDKVLVNKLVYDFRSPHRGEIIVFTAPDSWHHDPAQGADFIKRVIAVGGDRVVCCDDRQRLTVNGYALDEPYLYTQPDGTADAPSRDRFDVTVPPGRLWVMGDHRSASADSREHWMETEDITVATIAEDAVIGRAFVLFWPLGRATWLSVPATFDGVPAPAG